MALKLDKILAVDLHAHPSMKMFFGDLDLSEDRKPAKNFDLFGFRTSYPALRSGGLNVVCSSIYVPERDLQDDCMVFRIAAPLVSNLARALTSSADMIALEMMDCLERGVERANNKRPSGAAPIVVVKSFKELDKAVARGDIVLVHTIEGAHALDGNLGNLDVFKQRGVCSITLAHFYENGIAPPVDGVPDDFLLKQLGCFRRREDLTLGLTRLGKQVIEKMFDIGMIVDLTHCTPAARKDAYGIPNPKGRPLVMTHCGVYSRMRHPMNPTDAEIKMIANTGGVIGIIFYSHWLTDTHYKPNNDTLAHVVDTARHLYQLGGAECVALGSDFDGLTDPPDDLTSPAELGNLLTALDSAGFTDAEIEAFMGGNAMRVMANGWD